MNRYLLLFFIGFVSCNEPQKGLPQQDKSVILNRIAELKPKFKYAKDSFTNIYWYQPIIDTSSFGQTLRSKVYMDVREDGQYNLLSIYLGDRFISHNQLKFKLNDSVYSTAIKDSLTNALLKRQLSNHLVLERLVFTEKDDNKIPEQIYNSQGTVMVLFCGSQSDFGHVTLTDKEAQQIRDGYEISVLLKKVHEAEHK